MKNVLQFLLIAASVIKSSPTEYPGVTIVLPSYVTRTTKNIAENQFLKLHHFSYQPYQNCNILFLLALLFAYDSLLFIARLTSSYQPDQHVVYLQLYQSASTGITRPYHMVEGPQHKVVLEIFTSDSTFSMVR